MRGIFPELVQVITLAFRLKQQDWNVSVSIILRGWQIVIRKCVFGSGARRSLIYGMITYINFALFDLNILQTESFGKCNFRL